MCQPVMGHKSGGRKGLRKAGKKNWWVAGMLIPNLPRMYLDAVIYILQLEQEGSEGFPCAVDFTIRSIQAHVDVIMLENLLVSLLCLPG